MRKKSALPILAGAALLTLIACVTINVYFPEAAIKDISQAIEEEVEKAAEGEAAPAGEEPAAGEEQEQGGGAGLLDSLLGVTPVYAQDVPEPKISNPAIRKIIESRRGRIQEINRFKAKGAIGENNRALLQVRDLEALADLRARAAVQRLVKAENADRERLFKEIAAAEGVELSQLPRIRETYAETMRQRARPGDWIQMPDGNWRRK